MAKLTKAEFLAKTKNAREQHQKDVKAAGGRRAWKLKTGKFTLVRRSDFSGYCEKYGIGKPGRMYRIFDNGVKKYLNDIASEVKTKKHVNKVLLARVKFGMADNKSAEGAIARLNSRKEAIMKSAAKDKMMYEEKMKKVKTM